MLGESATIVTRQTKYQAFGMYASSAGIMIFASNATAMCRKAMGLNLEICTSFSRFREHMGLNWPMEQ